MGRLYRYITEPIVYGILPLLLFAATGTKVVESYLVKPHPSDVRGALLKKEPLEGDDAGYVIRVYGYPHDICVSNERMDNTANIGDMLDLKVVDDFFGGNKFCIKMDDGKE